MPGGSTAVVMGTSETVDALQGEFDLPMISYTPFAIFSNSIPIFDINFFNPMDDKKEEVVTNLYDATDHRADKITMEDMIGNFFTSYGLTAVVNDSSETADLRVYSNPEEELSDASDVIVDDYTRAKEKYGKYHSNENWKNMYIWAQWDKDEKKYKIYKLEAFVDGNNENKVEKYIANETLDANKESYNDVVEEMHDLFKNDGNLTWNKTEIPDAYDNIPSEKVDTYVFESSAKILQSTVSSGYVILRRVAIVGLMSVLLYLGIRIIIGSVGDKAKYKERLIDWIVALCLVFFMHYIMVFIVEITETLNEFFTKSCVETIVVELPKDTTIENEEGKTETLIDTLGDDNKPDNGNPIWSCSFVGYVRLIAGGFYKYDTQTAITYTIIYCVLIIYTVIFSIMYLKRVLYMAFLTIVAPLVAMMYPIDKINDGKAQGFNTWLREYIFNALMQPFHLLIYTIIVGSVMDLAIDYPVYAIVAIGFLIPAEKLLRKMLGFEKAETPSNMGGLGLTTAGILMSGINKLSHGPRRGKVEKGSKEDNNNSVKMKSDYIDTSDYINTIGNYSDENTGKKSLGKGGMEKGTTGINGIGKGINAMNSGTNGLSSRKGVSKGEMPINISRGVSKNKTKTLRNRAGNAILSVGTRYNRKFTQSHPLRSARRLATSAFGAASLGMVGAISGIASGNAGKVIQGATAAGMVGANLAGRIDGSVASETSNNIESLKQGWYGEEYKNILKDKKIKEYQSDPDNIQFLRERTSDYRKILKDAYPDYAKEKCSNIEDFWAAYQLEQAGYSRKNAISTYKMAQRVGDISKSPDSESKWKQKLEEEFAESSIVKSQQAEVMKKYEYEQNNVKQKYKEQRKKIENSNIGNKEEELKKMKKQKKKELEQLKQNNELKMHQLSNQIAQSAIDNVKQFYKNK